MVESNPEDMKSRRRNMIWIGVWVIAFGCVAGLISYYQDTHSFDIAQMWGAAHNAWTDVVVFGLVGLGIIGWYTIGPGARGRNLADDDRNDETER